MRSPPRHPSVGFWITVALVVALVGYPLSFGPAVWLTTRGYVGEATVNSFYWPVLWSAAHVPPLENAVDWWASLGIPDGELVTLEIETDEALVVFQFGECY